MLSGIAVSDLKEMNANFKNKKSPKCLSTSSFMKNIKSGFLLVALITFFTIHFSACNEKVTDPATFETDSISDIDGNVYKTVKIGDQWWMAENLIVQRYRNGDSIYFVSKSRPDSVWSNLKTGGYCYFEERYGFLYNFYSISDARGIAPAGWHIPSDDEWKELERTLGMSSDDNNKVYWRGTDQGNTLKKSGGFTMYWIPSPDILNISATNESGFSAVGGSCRVFNGLWGDVTHTAFWWTSTLNGNEAWYRSLDYNKSNVFRYYGPENYGFSIRCVKDK